MLKRIIFGSVILGALALYIFQIELKNDAIQAKVERPFEELLPLTIKSITINAPSGQAVMLEQRSVVAPVVPAQTSVGAADKSITEEQLVNWGLSDVPGADIDRSALNSLLSALQTMSLKDGLPASEVGEDKSIFGLSPAELKVKIDSTAGTRELSFGKLNEYVSQRYVQIDNDPALYLVAPELFNLAAKKRDDFRNKLPLLPYEGDVSDLTLSDPQNTYTFHHDDKWRMTSPQNVSVSDAIMTDVFRGIRSVRVSEYIDNASDKLANYGLDKPAFTMKAKFKAESKKQPIEAIFGQFKKTDGQPGFALQLAGHEGHVFVFDTNIQGKVIKAVNDYRERQLARFETSDATAIKIVKGESTIALKKNEDNSWTVGDKPGDLPFIEEYLHTLSVLEAKQFLDPKSATLGFDKPLGSVEVSLKGDKKRVIKVGAAMENAIRVVGVDDLSEPFAIDEAQTNKVLPALEVLVKTAQVEPVKSDVVEEPAKQ